MARVLAPGGQLMIYVWAMEQKNRRFEKQDVLVPWNRALCSRQQQQQQLLQRQLSGWGSGSSEAGTRTQGGRAHAGRGLQPPCSQCACSACFAPRGDSRRSHSMDEAPVVARRCCGESAKEGEDEDGFYNTLGKSFRSWFFSRSLDESTLRKQIERVKPAKTPEGWADGTVSIQPSRHPSLDWDPQEVFPPKDPNSDEEVLVETPAQPHGRRLRAGRSGAEGRRGPRALDAREDPAGAGDPEAGAAACAADASAFMRYYHVFREGELCELLREHVPQLRILSSGNDHGNWCVVAEKRESRG